MLDKSIFETIKKLVGPAVDDDDFDLDLLVHINTAISTAIQAGIGVPNLLVDQDTKWSDFINNETQVIGVISYIYLTVRLLFDPPQSSAAMEAMKEQAQELLWRAKVASSTPRDQ